MLEHIGQAAREARLAGGLRQIDIATTAGTSNATVSRFESGDSWSTNPDGLVDAYAAELGIEPTKLWEAALERWRAHIRER
jgi:transcriptional regulator with XRE-family HTH domain